MDAPSDRFRNSRVAKSDTVCHPPSAGYLFDHAGERFAALGRLAFTVLIRGGMGAFSGPDAPAVPRPSWRASHKQIFKFGAFELRTETGELRKNGVRIRLQTKPFQVLHALLVRPGELVTREELREKLWPAGTFVDFESGLNTAINRLRGALGDAAEAPRYVETLPRLGYRFICPVTETEDSDARKAVPAGAAADPAMFGSVTPVLPHSSLERRRFSRWKGIIAAAWSVVSLVVLGAVYLHVRVVTAQSKPAFRQVTFRTGSVGTARFSPDSEAVLYSAKWDSGKRKTYQVDLRTLTSRDLDFAPGVLAAVSPEGDIAMEVSDPQELDGAVRVLRVPLAGGAPEVIAQGVSFLDWAREKGDVALVRRVGLESRVEFPAGNKVYSSQGWIDCLRVSPKGDKVAFIEHPIRDDSAGDVRIADRNRRTRAVTGEWNSVEGLAWSSSGSQIFFTASKIGSRETLYAASESGAVRQVSNTPSSLRILDISGNGRFLIASDEMRTTMAAKFGNDGAETDLSRFDASHVDDISPDGRFVLFTEGGDGGGQHYTAYLHDHKLGCTTQIGMGRGLAISPDEAWVVSIDPRDRGRLTLTAIGRTARQEVQGGGFSYQWAKFLPHDRDLLVGGNFPGRSLAIYTQRISDGRLAPMSGVPYLDFPAVSPDGERIAGLDANRQMKVFELGHQQADHVPPLQGAFPVAWSSNGDDLFSLVSHGSAYQIVKTNLETGKIEPWKSVSPDETPGFAGLAGIVAAPDAGAYAYSTTSDFSRLYVVDGWS